MGKQFSRLMSPGYIGNVEIKNRIVSAPMMISYAARDGTVTPRLLRLYVNKARGGTGLIIVEMTYMDQIASQTLWNQLGAYDTACVGGLTVLARAIHDWGAKCAVQLGHAGNMRMGVGSPYLGPSDEEISEIPFGFGNVQVTGVTREQISQIIEDFGTAAARVKAAGFDMVELHAAHGYLLTAFLSPCHNKRTDEYGGSLENRMRFLLEIVQSVKKATGPDFPVTVRISGTDYEPIDPITIDDSLVIAKSLEEVGVAAIHVSGGTDRLGHKLVCAMYDKPGFNVYLADTIKNKSGIKIPVITCSSITTPAFADEILSQGKADFIGLGRASLADPEWGRKLGEDRPEDVVPCIRCLVGCTGTIPEFVSGRLVGCAVNPTLGCEDIRQVAPLENKKKVAIIGAGPGGMEAARLATIRGHDVTLYEKRKLGGALIEAGWDKELKSDIQNLLDYYRAQVKKLKINVVKKKASVDTIVKGGYDVAIVATGAVAQKLDIPGINKPHVYTDLQVTGGKDKELGKTVIVVGGGQIGMEIACNQALKGKRVIMTTRRGSAMGAFDLALDLHGANGLVLLERMMANNVEINTCLTLKEITDEGIVSVDKEGKSLEFKGDSVVICAGFLPDNTLAKALKGKVKEVRAIGDCIEPRYIFNAIHEGWVAANQI